MENIDEMLAEAEREAEEQGAGTAQVEQQIPRKRPRDLGKDSVRLLQELLTETRKSRRMEPVVMACSTPDIPSLLTHLESWKKTPQTTRGKIFIPDIPSKYRSLLPPMPEESVGALHPDLPRINWIMLTWDSTSLKLCSH